MIEKLRRRFEQYGSIPDQLWQEILNEVKVIEVPRQSILVHHNTCLRNVYYLLSGSLKMSQILEDGSSKAIWFHFEDYFDFTGCLDSYFMNEPSKYEISALEDSKVVRIKKVHNDNWVERYPEFSRAILHILEWDFMRINEVRGYMISHSSLDYYRYLQENFPHFLEKLPSYSIAEFMGITPEWYSKLQKKL